MEWVKHIYLTNEHQMNNLLNTNSFSKKEEVKTVWEKAEEELGENGEQKVHVVTDSELGAGGEVQ